MSSNSKYNFTGKVALVTGICLCICSSSGIGAAIAIQFAQFGASVAITGRNVENLNKIAQQIEQVSAAGAKPLQIIGDLQLDNSLPKRLIDETVAKFGRLDFLVNNAGGVTPNGRLESPNLLEEWDNVFRLNVRSVVELTQLAVPQLEKTKGNVINISSVAALKPTTLVYSSSKAALDMITKTAALELGPKGIRVNSINPSFVRTAIARSAGQNDSAYGNKFFDLMASKFLMNRIGSPVDIANLASFLASDCQNSCSLTTQPLMVKPASPLVISCC